MKPSIPRGTRDFGPAEMQKRHYIFNILKTNFQLYGYAPIETPSMENIGTLTGKYGEEGDQLIYKVLNSRIHESKDEKKELLKKEILNAREKIIDITVAIDKLDKIGKDGVINELSQKGISDVAIKQLEPLIDLVGSNENKVEVLKGFLQTSEIGKKGIEEVEFLLEQMKHLSINHLTIELDITLARGLNYYTGTIFEAKANAGTFTPSILGGGRYDDLTGIFGLKNMSGVGISFGVDRIYDVMEELQAFPETVNGVSKTKVLITNNGNKQQAIAVSISEKLRTHFINCEVYPDAVKIGKQFDYAEKKQIPFVLSTDVNENGTPKLTLKNIQTGHKEEVALEKLIELLK
jgi:histidyl-tRNA synthetase